jgi:hypothetical protein
VPYTNPFNNITAPPGATTGARIVLGPDVPTVLQTFAPANFSFVAAELYYYDDNNFYFVAVGTDFVAGTNVRVEGLYNGVNVIILEITHPSPNNILYGSQINGANGTNWFWEDGTATITLSADHRFEVMDPAVTAALSAGRGCVMGSYYTGGTGATSVGGAEAALVAWDAGVSNLEQDVTFAPGRLYEIRLRGGVFGNAAGTVNEIATVRVRSALNNTGAQLLGTARIGTPGLATGVVSFYHAFHVANKTAVRIDKSSLGVTVQRTTGANNAGVFGDAAAPLVLSVHDIGLYTDSALGEIAVAVT